ncbi:transposable element Tcb2 transposase [Trichonephila clavipes]|nr:transposable element Tcb2 transposase [Trichonephila clavipes]
MVWGATAYNTRSPLVRIHGTMTTQRYVHDILQPHVLPPMQRLPGAIFQQDKAQSHMKHRREHKLPAGIRCRYTVPMILRPVSAVHLQGIDNVIFQQDNTCFDLLRQHGECSAVALRSC